MTDQLLAPCEWKAVPGSSTGELEGYGVFYNNVDLGDDVALPGSARKTLADRRASGRNFPLIADHQLDTTGVVGSVTDAREDERGVRIRAGFASTHKAQDLRTLVLEGHVDGLSITYEALQHYPGERDGRRVRFLKEIRIHEFTITPFAMNPSARILAAKAGPGAVDADVEALAVDLERWARTVELEQAVTGMVEHPDSAMHALGVLSQARDVAQLTRLEAWVAQQPPAPSDGERAAARRAADWARRNRDSNELARVMATMPTCPHPGCMPGRCAYR